MRPPQQSEAPKSGMSLDDIVKAFATNTQQFQKETRASIQNLENQMNQLVTSMSKLEAQTSGKLPSQPINHREETKAMTLRSGKEIETTKMKKKVEPNKSQLEEEVEVHPPLEVQSKPDINASKYAPPPFPSRLKKNKKEEQEKELLDTFWKVEVNISLLDAIRQVPRYAKFLKELCTNKKKLRGDEKV